MSGTNGDSTVSTARGDRMLDALNELYAIKEKYKYVLVGEASNSLHMAIVHMERATADALLAEKRRAPNDSSTTPKAGE